MLKDLVHQNRSRRRFHQDVPVSLDTLRGLVDLARQSPSSANAQPLKYILSTDPETNAAIFANVGWAGYISDWPGPEEGERPAAYVVILGDDTITPSINCDHGIAAQTIMLGATEQGLGGCILASGDHDALRRLLDIPERYRIMLVLALGRPKEEVVLEPIGPDGNIRYYRDEDGVHHVPKRALDDLIIAQHG